MSYKNKIGVVVKYVGKDDFTDEVPSEMTVNAIKVRVLNFFDLEVGMADEYVLQYNNTDINEHAHIGSVGAGMLVLTLTLKDEVNKG